MNIEFVKSPNYSKGRNGKKIIAICNHITAGQFPGCQNWLCNPKAKASSNYLITRTGKIIQLVKDEVECTPRGAVNTKGKGEMEMYIVQTKTDVMS